MLYLIDLEKDEIHENQAAAILARGLAGKGIAWENDPKEGKICLYAETDGLLTVDAAALAAFNMVDEVMCASLHSHTLVKKGRQVAATRAVPLVMKRAPVERAAAIAQKNGGILSVVPLTPRKTGIVITGDEVFSGLIQDKFAPILQKKIIDLGSTVSGIAFAPDDVTRKGIQKAGVTEMHYGAAALPGAMFMVAYIGDIPLIGVPACGLHHRITMLNLVLPRILAGEHIGKKELAFLGHGGLYMDCPECVHPHCPFGKGM